MIMLANYYFENIDPHDACLIQIFESKSRLTMIFMNSSEVLYIYRVHFTQWCLFKNSEYATQLGILFHKYVS